MTALPPKELGHDDIALRIPHQGSMCLLDRVLAWDSDKIACVATSHRLGSNPLRAHGRLGAACGIEYAAQAMAIHGALVAESQPGSTGHATMPKAGYLVSVRSVTLHVERLDELQDDLAIEAERIMGDAGTIVYGFTIQAGPALLVSGRATVILEAPATSFAASSSRSNP